MSPETYFWLTFYEHSLPCFRHGRFNMLQTYEFYYIQKPDHTYQSTYTLNRLVCFILLLKTLPRLIDKNTMLEEHY